MIAKAADGERLQVRASRSCAGVRAIANVNPMSAAIWSMLLIVSAALLSTEISSRSYPLLGWFTLLPLLAAIRILPMVTAGASGALWGGSLFVFLALSGNPSIDASFASFSLLAGAPAAYSLAMGWATRRYGFHPLILAFAWSGVELALLPLGLNGGVLGGIAGDSAGVFGLLQSLFGYVCIAALVVGVNAIALAWLSQVYTRACADRRFILGSVRPYCSIIPQEIPVRSLLRGNAARPRAPPFVA